MSSIQKSIEQYTIIGTLGLGNSAKVKLAENRITHEKYAIKILKKENLTSRPNIYAKLQREIALMSLFEHPHILKLYEVFESERHLHIVMEYAENRELFDLLVQCHRLSENEGVELFRQIIYALDYLHIHGICHRDLKPENILLDANNNIKIADFGFARWMKSDVASTSCGSPHYAAPEVIRAQPYSGRQADVWSAGVILFAILSGRLPFDDNTLRNLLMKIKKGEYEMPPMLHPDIQDLISKMLVVDPAKRITIPDIKQHPAFRLHLPPAYILPTPLPLPNIEDPIDPAEIQPQLLKVLKQIGYKDEQELADDLQTSGHTMAKVFHYMLTRETNQASLPWSEAHHYLSSNNNNRQNHDNIVIRDNNGNNCDEDDGVMIGEGLDDDLGLGITSPPDSNFSHINNNNKGNNNETPANKYNASPGSVYSLAQKADWAVGDSIMIAYEQEETISAIHGSVASVMLAVQSLMNELRYDWFYPDDWGLIARSSCIVDADQNVSAAYLTFDVETAETAEPGECAKLIVRMNGGSEATFKEIVEKITQVLTAMPQQQQENDQQENRMRLDTPEINDSKDEMVPDLDA